MGSFSIRNLLPKKLLEHLAYRQMVNIQLTSADIAIDCGANVGLMTEQLAKNGATVYAFEPNPHAFATLQARFANHPHVHCLPKGVGVQNSQFKLYLHEHSDNDEVRWSTGSSFLDFKGNVRSDKYVEVDVIDLSAFVFDLGRRVKILKMDVEGVECQIIRHMIETDAVKQIDHIFVETHEDKIPELRQETEQLRTFIQENKLTHINLDWT